MGKLKKPEDVVANDVENPSTTLEAEVIDSPRECVNIDIDYALWGGAAIRLNEEDTIALARFLLDAIDYRRQERQAIGASPRPTNQTN